MSKTNFKCMYLIDDILYKDMISKNRKSDHNLESTSHLQYQDPSISKDYFIRGDAESLKDNRADKEADMNFNQIKENELQHATFHKTDLPIKTSNTEDADCKCMISQGEENGKVSGLDVQIQTDLKGEKRKTDESLHKQEISNKGENIQMDGVNQRATETAKKRKYSGENYDGEQSYSFPENGVKRKMGRRKRIKHSRQSENNSESDDEKEWEELRKRYYKLRYGYSDDDSAAETASQDDKRKSGQDEQDILSMTKQVSPRRKQVYGTNQSNKRIGKTIKSVKPKNKSNHILNQKPSISNSDNVSFHCTICDSQFKKFASLSRHMKNIHGEYFEEWNRQNKRKNEDKFSTNKRFKSDGSLKRKATTDGPDVKRAKEEFLCMFCQRYFRSSAGLKRHTKNQHGTDTNREKRKNADANEERYLKRQKTKKKVPVTYQNYF